MNKILMILTSHRLDCFRLCMDMLIHGGSIHRFDRVVLLLNGVKGRHLRYVQKLQARHPDIPWDTVAGPRGRGVDFDFQGLAEPTNHLAARGVGWL